MSKLGVLETENQRLTYEASQKTIEDLRQMYDSGRLELNPSFQRESVWRERDRMKLVESILRMKGGLSFF
jgi:hypothetical protein